MNSTFEHNKSQTSMEDLKAMQTKANFARNMEKAGNIQKAVTLTEENWTGLSNAADHVTVCCRFYQPTDGGATAPPSNA